MLYNVICYFITDILVHGDMLTSDFYYVAVICLACQHIWPSVDWYFCSL